MIILGAILLILGLVLGISVLTILGIVLLVLGLIPAVSGGFGRPIGGRRWYY